MNLGALRKGALLVMVSAMLIVVVTLLGFCAFVYYNSEGGGAGTRLWRKFPAH